jgi:antitoxin (DNA-binding transcriptional repressor) of toxin-antitoxin stability system
MFNLKAAPLGGITGQIDRSNPMKEIPASEAAVKLFELLDEVEQGTTIAMTRDGKVVAHIAPYERDQPRMGRQAIQGIRELRNHTKAVTAEELIAWKNEGRE